MWLEHHSYRRLTPRYYKAIYKPKAPHDTLLTMLNESAMHLDITVNTDGSLACYIDVDGGYRYTVASWAVFLAATGTEFLCDYGRITIRGRA